MGFRVGVSSLIALFLVLPASVEAGNHSWVFTEAFSNADGSAQFVEMFCPIAGEFKMSEAKFSSTATGNLYLFDQNLPHNISTENTWILISTTAFASLEGAPVPDYIIPDAFFDPAGDTLNYKSTTDVWILGAIPVNGIDSLDRSTGVGPNTPKNFAGVEGFVDASQPVPGLAAWALVVLAGMLLLGASGLVGSGKSLRSTS